MYLATINPSSISVRYETNKRPFVYRYLDNVLSDTTVKNLSLPKSSMALSYQSKKKLFQSIQYLSLMSPERTVKVSNSKMIYNFKTSFITLTLPSAQLHSDLAIKKCFNVFLTNLRTTLAVKNYVWKAELQLNENIHFHLILDTFVHHTVVRYYWNKALNSLGYIDDYSKKFSALSLADYALLRNVPVFKAISGFMYGNSTKWKNPPTEQVVACKSDNEIAGYLQKYISKPVLMQSSSIGTEKSYISIKHLVRVRNFGRVWGRSQSLSRIAFGRRYDWNSLKDYLRTISKDLKDFIIKDYQYCTIYYLSKKPSKMVKEYFLRNMADLGITYRYVPPT